MEYEDTEREARGDEPCDASAVTMNRAERSTVIGELSFSCSPFCLSK